MFLAGGALDAPLHYFSRPFTALICHHSQSRRLAAA
jgi:hypothetical protein